MSEKKPTLPTYQTIAATLEGKTGSGVALLGWTIARAALIAPPFMLVGVEPKKALGGALLASSLISVFAMARIYNAASEARAAEDSRDAFKRRLSAAKSRLKASASSAAHARSGSHHHRSLGSPPRWAPSPPRRPLLPAPPPRR